MLGRTADSSAADAPRTLSGSQRSRVPSLFLQPVGTGAGVGWSCGPARMPRSRSSSGHPTITGRRTRMVGRVGRTYPIEELVEVAVDLFRAEELPLHRVAELALAVIAAPSVRFGKRRSSGAVEGRRLHSGFRAMH
eukprot:6130106-Pleurochrysis_carterae.AAC.1